MEKSPNPEDGGGTEEFASIIEKLKSKMPWVNKKKRPREETAASPAPSKPAEILIEPKKEETWQEYKKRRGEEMRIEKLAKAKKDLEKRKRLYEKYKSQMDENEKCFHEGRIRDEEKEVEQLEKQSVT